MTTTRDGSDGAPPLTAYRDAPNRSIAVGGVTYAYRELGPVGRGVPVVFFVHLAANLDNWDPRIVDAIAQWRHVIAFDNRGSAGRRARCPTRSRQWLPMPSRSSGRSVTSRSTSSRSPSAG